MIYSEEPDPFDQIPFEKKGCLTIIVGVILFWITILILNR